MVRPGIFGMSHLNDPKQAGFSQLKEEFKQDLFYLENMSLSFDLRIIMRALLKILFRR